MLQVVRAIDREAAIAATSGWLRSWTWRLNASMYSSCGHGPRDWTPKRSRVA